MVNKNGWFGDPALTRRDQEEVAFEAGLMDYMDRGVIDLLTYLKMRSCLADEIRMCVGRSKYRMASDGVYEYSLEGESFEQTLSRISGEYEEQKDPQVLNVGSILSILTERQRESVIAGVFGEAGAQRRLAERLGITEQSINGSKMQALKILRGLMSKHKERYVP